MSRDNYIGTRGEAVAKAIESLLVQADERPVLVAFEELDNINQHRVLERIVRAQRNVIGKCVNELRPYNVPYIGRVDIMKGKKVEIAVITQVAKERGIEDISELSAEEYENIRVEVKGKISSKYINDRRKRNEVKVMRTSAKVMQFNLKKYKKT